MKLVRLDLKKNFASLIVESANDVLALSKIVKAGDSVRARTFRKPTIFRNGQTIEGQRRAMVLTINVEKCSYIEGRLRLLGTIKEGPADVPLGAHHTIEVEPGLKIDIYKLWKVSDIKLLKKACTVQPKLLFCLIDRDLADFFLLSEQKIVSAGTIPFKKVKEEERDQWYEKIVQWLTSKQYELAIIAGPGFERENLFSWIAKNRKDLLPKISLEHASTTGKSGVHEIMKKSGNKLLRQTAIAKETELVQQLLKEIKMEGAVVYGKEEVEHALAAGAVKMLLVSEPMIDNFESLIDSAESQKAMVEIITTGHEAGDMFLALGGIAAFLRFAIK
jgi:protein pelota